MLGKKTTNRGRNPLVWLAPQTTENCVTVWDIECLLNQFRLPDRYCSDVQDPNGTGTRTVGCERTGVECSTKRNKERERNNILTCLGASQTKGFRPLLDVFSLASNGFLEHLTMPTVGALPTKCLQTPCQ